MKQLGVVKWFNDSKGYGFITNDSNPDIYCHYSAIETPGFKTLSEGQVVSFMLVDGAKGPQAVKIEKTGQVDPRYVVEEDEGGDCA